MNISNLTCDTEGKYICPICNKSYTAHGIGSHIWRSHGLGKSHDSNIGLKTGNRKIWNKGLTKATDERVKQFGNTLHTRFINNELTPGWTGRHHSTESKQLIGIKLSSNNKGGKCKWFDYIHNNEIVKLQGTWEVRFACFLDTIDSGWIKPKLYGQHSFSWMDDSGTQHTYTPDFFSPRLNKYFEVKGYWWGNDKLKMQRVIEQHPEVKIEIVHKKQLELYEALIK